MITAKNAGVTSVFYNGACWDRAYIDHLFHHSADEYPDVIINSFDELMDLLALIDEQQPGAFLESVETVRPPAFAPPEPPAQHIEPDWHPSVAKLAPPKAILFDWHATLVDTLDAMYRAVDDMLPEMKAKGLLDRMVDPASSKSPEDARLVEYVQSHSQLHPKIKADRKISRTDIFEVLFGRDEDAKKAAHKIFNHHYRNHYGTVLPFEPQVKNLLIGLRALGLQVGVITNRDREFFEHELRAVETTGWTELFDTDVCGDDTVVRKPNPDQLLLAAKNLDVESAKDVWYVGDSTTDIAAAQRANQTAVFFNGAQWDLPWLEKIFPGTESHPYKPDVVVNDFSEFWALVLACMEQ
jgi:phosphoglycolate phosphatase